MKNIKINHYTTILLFIWTVIILFLIFFDISKINQETDQLAIAEAKANFNKDQAIRYWASSHGGIYVPSDSLTPPNPNLSQIVDRDIVTPSGKKLTLMNPAYMIRQLNDYFTKYYGVVGHITSKKLMRPENKPDAWELNALNQFEKGIKEISGYSNINDDPYFRLMQPMLVDQSCLKCHAHQGYKVDDIRGGVSVSIPMTKIFNRASIQKERSIYSFSLLWVIGIIGLFLGSRSLTNSFIRQKLAEDAAVKAKEKAEESDRLKSAFLANMSHEIRTPMNGIMGFASLLRLPNLTGEQQTKYVSIIEKSGTRMLNIINDLVDISKIEAGQMELTISDCNINEQIEYLYAFFKPEAKKNGLTLSAISQLPREEAIIKTDCEKLYAIFTNLIKNSIKYSDEGSIEFGYVKKGEILEFYVKDTGIGIPKERQAAIFERFVQADIEDKNVYEGAGLGLAITKAYVEMLDGDIWVDSVEGRGTQFYFTIPYRTQKTVVAPSNKENISLPKTESFSKDINVLIAEDEEFADTYLSIIVNDFSNQIYHAKTGLEAIEICDKNPDIDLILMDIKMPKMDGYEATQKIRETNKDVIIIAQTAYALAGDREKAIAAGCDDYISKPIDKNELMKMIERLVSG